MRTMYAAVIAASFWRSSRAAFARGCFTICCLITLIFPCTCLEQYRVTVHREPLQKLEHLVLNAALT
jgi:hypothetical protein